MTTSLSELRPKVWTVPIGYRTPASYYELAKSGTARLVRRPYPRGIYEMCGVNGYAYYRLTRSHKVTALTIRRKTWMVDDPLHWEEMQKLAAAVRGPRVLVAGLGLGLILHALKKRDDLEEVVVCERSPDVIGLIAPLVPEDARVRLACIDFWDYANEIEPDRFTSIFWDLAVGPGPTLWQDEVGAMYYALDAKFGEHAMIHMFGFEGIVSILRSARVMFLKVREMASAKSAGANCRRAVRHAPKA
jgi:hypothetical protein